ncbi:MAG TPA: 2-hydroxyacid dehydrogenase [Polyangiaceae bacterium]|nr:2-hydroxyacid dehydrogenase [Polyangiaceae bacterium]
MKVGVFSTQPYDRDSLSEANRHHGHELVFSEARLDTDTVQFASSFDAVVVFVNDALGRNVLESLRAGSTRLIALRCAGFNNVDVAAARELGLTLARVPAYSPHAVAEHAVGLILCLNRKYHRAYARVREANFSLVGLGGFDLQGRTVGVVGTGAIGLAFARIMLGFECRVLAYDPWPSPKGRELGLSYVSLNDLLRASDIVSLHCPLTPETHHLINASALAKMKRGVMLINTGRGALIDANAAIAALKSGQLGYFGIDVYEQEEKLFFRDMSEQIVQDDVFMRLLTFPNVLVTAHQGFFTREALANIADTTLANLTAFERGAGTLHRVPDT